MTALIGYAALALGVSFLCSLIEAGLLSLPPSYVTLLGERGSWTGRQLQELKSQIDRPLSAILTLNTIAHTVGAAGVGAEATALFGDAALGVASAIITFLILVVSEIIPKTLGTVHAKPLAGFTVVATRLIMVLAYPVVITLGWLSRLIGRSPQESELTRGELLAAVRLSRQAGSLGLREYHVLHNMMSLKKIKLHQILTPRPMVFALSADQTVGDVFSEHGVPRFSRIPLYHGSLDHVTEYVSRFELSEEMHSGREATPLAKLARPIGAVPEQASANDALEQMLEEQEHLLVVVDEYGGFEGLVSLEDVLEALLGVQIVDETDAEIDLRAAALRRARDRHASDDEATRDG